MSANTQELEIPVINISGYLHGDAAAKKSCASELRHAFEEVGFLQITGHSVSSDLQKRFIAAVAAFFSLPLAEKKKIGQEKSPCNRGYERIGVEKLEELEDDTSEEQKEGFTVRPERPLGRFMNGPNQWPDPSLPGMSDFRKIYMDYFDAMHNLSTSMFRLIALSLDLDEHYFDAFAADPSGKSIFYFTRGFWLIVNLHMLTSSRYPALPLTSLPSHAKRHHRKNSRDWSPYGLWCSYAAPSRQCRWPSSTAQANEHLAPCQSNRGRICHQHW
jgi:non-haem dioxygenase in morphine synthesis N-terminal